MDETDKPAKWISKDGKTAWLVIAANCWGQPPNPKQCVYAWAMHGFRFVIADEQPGVHDPPSGQPVSPASAEAQEVEETETGPWPRAEGGQSLRLESGSGNRWLVLPIRPGKPTGFGSGPAKRRSQSVRRRRAARRGIRNRIRKSL